MSRASSEVKSHSSIRSAVIENLEARQLLAAAVPSYLTFDLLTDSYRIARRPDGMQEIISKGLNTSGRSGMPDLPGKTLRIALPPTADLSTVRLSIRSEHNKSITGSYSIAPAPLMAVGETVRTQGTVNGKNVAIYSRNQLFDRKAITMRGVQQMGAYKFVELNYSPFAYNPVARKVMLTDRTQFRLTYSLKGQAYPMLGTSSQLKGSVYNAQQASAWYSKLPAAPTDSSLVIITTEAIKNSSLQLANFVNHKNARGISTQVVTETTWGGSFGDAAAENIRDWLSTNWSSLGIQNVLLIGNPDPQDGNVPMKMAYPNTGDLSYEESPTDYYFADLTENWDSDGDDRVGEWGDDFSAKPLPEVNVGRIPVYSGDLSSLDLILSKIQAYENETDISWRKNMLLPAAISNYGNEDGGGAIRNDGASWGEAIKNDLADPNGYGTWRMYEEAGLQPVQLPSDQPLTPQNVINTWASKPYGLVNWWAHGSTTGAFRKYWGSDDNNDNIPDADEMIWEPFVDSTSVSPLNDQRPSIVVQVSCENGTPEVTNNLGYELLKNGAIATISASRVSWYAVTTWAPAVGQAVGDNASYAYYMTKRLVENFDTETVGGALNWARTNLGAAWGGPSWMNVTDFNLFGDPTLMPSAQSIIPGVDLTGTGMSVQTPSLKSGTTDVSFEVSNNGNIDADAFDVRFYLSDDANITPGSDMLLSIDPSDPAYVAGLSDRLHISSLAATSSYDGLVKLIVPSRDPFRTDGVYYIGMVIDLGNAVDEQAGGGESNNRNVGVGRDSIAVDYQSYVYTATMDSDPGWTFTGAGWAWGKPAGQFGDPFAGYTGDSVVGYNLGGAYPDLMSTSEYAYTPVIDCSNYYNLKLQFRRWLGVESSVWDKAGIQITTDGVSWTSLWSNSTDTIVDSAWQLETFDISQYADYKNKLQIRWSMGPTDSIINYAGWNIDDVVVVGSEAKSVEVINSAPNPSVSSRNSVTFNFNRPMDERSFSLLDVSSFYGPAGDLRSSLLGYSWIDSRTLRVFFQPQNVVGDYTMTIGPSILAINGDPMDQDLDTIAGESEQDAYTATFAVEPQKNWTVMVYMDGDNALEAEAINDFLELANIGSAGQVNIIVQLDRRNSYDTRYGNWTDTRRGIVQYGSVPDANWGESIGETNMGYQASLSMFANWAISQFPAQHYALIVWDHGGAIRNPSPDITKGTAWDDTNGNDFLETREISGALSVVPKLDLLAFDSSTMGMLETAYQFRNEAQVYVASQTREPAGGYNYGFLSVAATTPGLSAEGLGQAIVTSYANEYGDAESQSAFRMTGVAAFGSAMGSLAYLIETQCTGPEYMALKQIRTSLTSVGGPDTVDVGTLLTSIKDNSAFSAAIRASAATALQTYLDARIASHSGSGVGGTGLSVYFQPALQRKSTEYLPSLYAFAANTRWDEFLVWWQRGSGANLAATSFNLNRTNVLGVSSVNATFTILNSGVQNALTGAFDVRFVWSPDADFSNGDEISAKVLSSDPSYNAAKPDRVTIASLGAGASATRTVAISVPVASPFLRSAGYLGIIVDSGNTVPELDETDNINRGDGIDRKQVLWLKQIVGYPMDTNPGWTLQGAWSWGIPGGNAGDPTAGFTGPRVVGYNLFGAYPANMAITESATTPAFSTLGYDQLQLSFMRKLTVESGAWDGAAIQGSVNGVDWINIWTNETAVADANWVAVDLELPAALCDMPTVRLRWTMGLTDNQIQLGGWNLDDVYVYGIGNSPTTGVPDLLTDTGVSSTDNLTNLNNSSPSKSLTFRVNNVTAGALVLIYADGQEVGSAVATGTTVDIVTDGATYLADGQYQITARQVLPDSAASAPSAPLGIQVDSWLASHRVQVNDGDPQRSVVSYLEVIFDEPVTITSPLLLQRAGLAVPGVDLDITNPTGDRRNYIVAFGGSATAEGSLPDGLFSLKALAGSIVDDAGNALTLDVSTRFHRLFGDSDGDRDVDSYDLFRFRQSLNRPADYVWYFDANADGFIDDADYIQLRQRMSRSVIA